MCWLEIPVHDVARAQALYADVFGWECAPDAIPHACPGIKSMHFFSHGSLHGAFLLADDGYEATKHRAATRELLPPLPTFCVDECAETLAKVQLHQGSVQCPKTEIGAGKGYFARFTDAEGNVIGIWSPN